MRLARGSVAVILVVLAFCVLVTWQRERTNLRSVEHTILHKYIEPLQEVISRQGTLPLVHPLADADGQLAGPFIYLDSESIRVLRTATHPVLIGSTGLFSPFLHRDCLFVAIYDQGRVWAEWMTAAEFKRRILSQSQWILERVGDVRQTPPLLP